MDNALEVGECDGVTGGDDVMDTYECSAESIGDNGGVIAAGMRVFFDCFSFHVSVSDCCYWWCWVNVVLPL